MDIVERLRICAKYDPDQAEGADEIERLREEVKRLRKALQAVADAYGTGQGIGAQGVGGWLDQVRQALENK